VITADLALTRLIEGNRRFASGAMNHPHQDTERRSAVEKGQQPFAAVICCSDSRVPAEILFDLGIGDLFVIRLAGNIVTDEVIASVEYAAAHLHVPLVVVLGHTGCGAIKAALADTGKPEGHIPSLVSVIKPSIAASVSRDADSVARVHAMSMADKLRKSMPLLKPLVDSRALVIASARYDLHTGIVEMAP